MKTASFIEALLFSRAEPWTKEELSKTLGLSAEEITVALEELGQNLSGRGLVLVRAGEEITLGTHPEASALLEKLFKDELEKPLSKASVETLSIILYGEDVTRGKIDYIRGVNSSFILRQLLVRGMIERRANARDKKRFIYVPTPALLSQLGAENTGSLPDYERIHDELLKAASGAELTEDIHADTPEQTNA